MIDPSSYFRLYRHSLRVGTKSFNQRYKKFQPAVQKVSTSGTKSFNQWYKNLRLGQRGAIGTKMYYWYKDVLLVQTSLCLNHIYTNKRARETIHTEQTCKLRQLFPRTRRILLQTRSET